MFDREQSPRKECIWLADNQHWNNFILVAIIVNCLLMAFLYDPLDVESHKTARDGLDIFFTFLFMFEMFVKIIATGLAFGPNAYLKDGWNVMDGTIVWVSFVCLDFVSGGVEGLGGVRAMRGIRPLRTLSRFKSGALFVNTLFSSWVYIVNVSIFLLWFIVLAACSGTVLFMGNLRSRCIELPEALIAAAGGNAHKATCPSGEELMADEVTYPLLLDEATGDPVVCGVDFQNCPSTHTCCYYGDEVANGKIRFDNILWSALITFQGLTVDGWNEVCYLLMDGLGWPVLLWYALVVVLGAFFVMQLLSAVIVTSLQKCSEDQKLIDQLEKERDRAEKQRRIDAGEKAEKSAGRWSLAAFWESDSMASTRRVLRAHIPALYDFAETEQFGNFIMLMIVVNTVVMMTRHYPETDEFEFANVIMEYIFNAVFFVEFIIKHLGYGLAGYWSVGWNRLDGIIVLSSVVDTISPLMGDGVDLGFMRALRVLRVMRAVRVLKAAPEAMAVMNSMVVSLMSMGGFLLVWLIFMLIYALLGTRLFGEGCVFQLDEDAGRLSFKSFMRAMLTLFVTASGEDGFDVMHWTMEGSGNAAALFMISWMIISQIILSLLLALLIDTYSVDEEEEEELDEDGQPVMKTSDSQQSLNRELVELESKNNRSKGAEDGGGGNGTMMEQIVDTAEGLFAKENGGKSEKSGKSRASSLASMRSDQRARRQASKLLSRLQSEDVPPEERDQHLSRIELLQKLQLQRTQHDVACVRQWLYDIDFDTDALDADGSLPIEVTMTQEQEAKAKERLSLIKKNFKMGGVEAERRREKFRQMTMNRIIVGPVDGANSVQKTNSAKGSRKLSEFAGEEGSEEGGIGAAEFDEKNSGGLSKPARRVDKEGNPIESDATGASGPWGYMGSEWVKIVENTYFTNFILFAILWSSIMLAMETPTFPAEGSNAATAFLAIDITFTIVFTIEMVLQWMALGLGGYFKQLANRLDFIIVFTAWLSLILEWSGVDANTLTALRSLRLLRILRPLRAVRRLPSLRMVVDCTLNALPAIKWIMVLGMFLAMILGLFGMQFFGGKLWSCKFPEGVQEAFGDFSDEASCVGAGGVYGDRTLTTCQNEAAAAEFGEPYASAAVPVTVTECVMPEIVTAEQCEAYGGTWANTEYNFDSIGQSLVVVFITSTADNWQDAMYDGIDSVDVGKNMIYEYNLWNAMYYVIVTMLSCFFWANMFVSTLVDQYTKASEAEGVLVLEDHMRSDAMNRALLLARQQAARQKSWKERESSNKFVAACIAIGSNPWFGTFMMGVICLNGFLLCCIHADQPAWLSLTDYVSGIIFQTLYCAEVVILMTAMGPSTYIEDPWNRFDLFIVVAGVIELSVPGDAPWVAVLRTFRIMRLFKIVKGLKELRILMYTIISALPGVSNIGVLLFLLMFMYACLGVTLYGEIGSPYGYPDGLNKYTNFRSWPNAMFTLFVIFTGNWESIFRATYWECEGGPADWGRECTYRYSAPFYFFSYFLLANCVLGNLFVSIILDKFTAETTADDKQEASLIEVVQLAFVINQFRTMLAQKIRIYRLLTGKLTKREHEKAEKQYWRHLKDYDWDGGVLSHEEAYDIVINLKSMRTVMYAAARAQEAAEAAGGGDGASARAGSPTTVLGGEKSEDSAEPGERKERMRFTRVVDADGGSIVDARDERAGRSDVTGPARSVSARSRRSSRPEDPERDAARARRRKAREEKKRRQAEAAIPEDELGDDFMSPHSRGKTPGPGPTRPGGGAGAAVEAEGEQNWLSGCSFIPGLDYCAGPANTGANNGPEEPSAGAKRAL